jgi:hypothetical protein
MSGDEEIIGEALIAWSRIRRGASFNDWLAVGKALALARAECMREAKSNKPLGTAYNRLMGAWLKRHGLDSIRGQERYRCLQVLDNLPEIEAWRAGLSEEKRRRLNHPGAVIARWTADKKISPYETSSPRHIAEGNGRGHDGKLLSWPQVMLQRASEAIHAARTDDTILLAKAALQAALRCADDVEELLDANQPRRAQSQPLVQAEATA